MRIQQGWRTIGGVLAAASVLLAEQAPAFGAEPAVWVKKNINFTFQGFTSYYSCQGLEDTVRSVLLQLGARKSDMKLRQTGCAEGPNRPSPFPGVTGSFYVLEPASSGHSEESPSEAPPPKGQPDRNGATVDAEWRTVNVSLGRGAREQAGECELIDQTKAKILPLFAARNVKFQSTCVPNQVMIKGSTLQADVLKPVSHVARAAE